MTAGYNGKAQAEGAPGRTPRGSRAPFMARGGEAPGNQLGASRSPQRGRRDGRAQGRTPPTSTAPGRGRQQAGAARAQKARGAQPKKGGCKPPLPPVLEPLRPQSPAGGEPGGAGEPGKGRSRTPQRQQGRPPPQGARSSPRGKARPPGALATTEGASPHTGASFEAGGWRSGPAPASEARAKTPDRGQRRAPRPGAGAARNRQGSGREPHA